MTGPRPLSAAQISCFAGDNIYVIDRPGACWGAAMPGTAQRRRTGIEPADDAMHRPPVLKTGGATRHPDASGADVTRAWAAPATWALEHAPPR
jgi:hypothetical protein